MFLIPHHNNPLHYQACHVPLNNHEAYTFDTLSTCPFSYSYLSISSLVLTKNKPHFTTTFSSQLKPKFNHIIVPKTPL